MEDIITVSKTKSQPRLNRGWPPGYALEEERITS